MTEDPTIEKIREVRRKISEEHGHDTEKLLKHYQEMEKKTTRKFFHKDLRENKVV